MDGLGIEMTVWNLLLFFLGCVALAIGTILVIRWASKPGRRHL